ncbi:histone-like nucleoid-structuring protein, MvaT/MvaU family [Pseudomonas sp. TCU-HL1]|uniref:histone-like nucleoid-structuring protein, MvaT/MvaU family n=1 Tax=Pseudomonas sp. TCU-HL1 TaxID=1856685 RepID=UPI00083D8A55|nr:histone-like nucleoid-structuring protein, MvaT/MvaU family [Pseudomonas sp. TCU-HL1]AOE88108.1 transcriptional regulator [Pseudomonas sp. TCU-HL1]
MSKLAEFKALEAQLAEQLKQLDAMKSDVGLKREIEFESKLRALMAEYDIGLRGIIALLDPQVSVRKESHAAGQRRARQIKTYKNPHTGEAIQTKGGNHRVLKAWKAEFGAQTVESWLQ